jgi:hypothetical protein
MHDDRDERRQQAKKIQEELNKGRLSRRGLFQRFRLLGVGFGAAYLLGAKEAGAVANSKDAEASDAVASLKSTNPALNDVIDEGRQHAAPGAESGEDGGSGMKTAFRRVFRRVYRRI